MVEYPFEIETGSGDNDLLPVTFYAKPRVENDGIGAYEYWGAKCYDRGNTYVDCSYYGIWWDKDKFTPEQNEVIEKYYNANHDHIEELLILEYEEILSIARDNYDE